MSALAAFLDSAGWADATHEPLDGDASARTYTRLRKGDATAMLMQAPAGSADEIDRFIRLAAHLRGLSYSAPQILAAAPGDGWLLLEDFGQDLFARLLDTDPTREADLYAAATDLLADLHRHPAPAFVTAYDPEAMASATDLAWTWYAGTPDAGEHAQALLRDALAAHWPDRPVLALRDFHTENLFWLPQRAGLARVGLIDFQDAVATHPAYDLVSMTRDARRDVSEARAGAVTTRYAGATGTDPDQLAEASALLATQRNLRILGIFARLCLRDGKTRYAAFVPRVWRYLVTDLSHPALAELRTAVMHSLPAPETDLLHRLETGCRPAP